MMFAFFGLADSSANSQGELSGQRPNIILILTDDQGYGELSCHGHPWLSTPHLDQLHRESVRLTDFHVSPTCAPTRAAIMTGRHEFMSGVTHTIIERERMALDAFTLPQVLQSADYKTAIFGKWHLGDEDAYQPKTRGFDEVFIHGGGGIGQRYPDTCADVPGNSYFDPVINHNGKFVKTNGFCTDVFFQQATNWIEEQKQSDESFFVYLSLNAAHSPFHAPRNYTKKFFEQGMNKQLAGFYGMIENIDDNVGQLMVQLKAWELEENTLVIFMTDNGTTVNFITNGNQKLTKFIYSAGMKGHKNTPDEGGTRVPCFIRWKGHLPEGADVETLTGHIDLLPTLADLAGAELPANGQMEGRSLVPLLQLEEIVWQDRYLFTHCGRWPRGVDPEAAKYDQCAVRNERFRLINNKELYDIDNDPGQKVNVADKHPEVVQAMQFAYDAWWIKAKKGMVNETAKNEGLPPYVKRYQDQLESEGVPAWEP